MFEELDNQIAEHNKIITKSEQEIVKRNAIIERKQNQVDIMSKKLNQMIANAGVSSDTTMLFRGKIQALTVYPFAKLGQGRYQNHFCEHFQRAKQIIFIFLQRRELILYFSMYLSLLINGIRCKKRIWKK